jgi:hypothetical protein
MHHRKNDITTRPIILLQDPAGCCCVAELRRLQVCGAESVSLDFRLRLNRDLISIGDWCSVKSTSTWLSATHWHSGSVLCKEPPNRFTGI